VIGIHINSDEISSEKKLGRKYTNEQIEVFMPLPKAPSPEAETFG